MELNDISFVSTIEAKDDTNNKMPNPTLSNHFTPFLIQDAHPSGVGRNEWIRQLPLRIEDVQRCNENVLDKNVLRNKTIHYIKNDIIIGASIKNGIYWESWMFNYIKENYIENTNIIDLGGNIGTTALLMSEVLSENCKIMTFEPIFSDILLKNVVENNLSDKVVIYPYGVGNEIKKMKIKPVNLTDNLNFILN